MDVFNPTIHSYICQDTHRVAFQPTIIDDVHPMPSISNADSATTPTQRLAFQSISLQKEYEQFSTEELRFIDYLVDKKTRYKREQPQEDEKQVESSENQREDVQTIWSREVFDEMESPPRRPRVRLPPVTAGIVNVVAVEKLQDELEKTKMELKELRDRSELLLDAKVKMEEEEAANNEVKTLQAKAKMKVAAEQAEVAQTQAVFMAEKKASVKISIAENRLKLAMKKLAILKDAAVSTPLETAKSLWDRIQMTGPPAGAPIQTLALVQTPLASHHSATVSPSPDTKKEAWTKEKAVTQGAGGRPKGPLSPKTNQFLGKQPQEKSQPVGDASTILPAASGLADTPFAYPTRASQFDASRSATGKREGDGHAGRDTKRSKKARVE